MVNNNIYFCGTAEPFKKETWLECSIGATTKATSIVQIRNPNNDIPSEKICKKYRISQNFWAAENEKHSSQVSFLNGSAVPQK
jgi:hypothetical protein